MIYYSSLNNLRQYIRKKNDLIAEERKRWILKNPYFYNELLKTLQYIVNEGAKVLHVRCSTGFILNRLKPKLGIGIDDSEEQLKIARKNYSNLTFIKQDLEEINIDEKFEYILITHIEDVVDIKSMLDSLKKCCNQHTRIIICYNNYLWSPVIRFAEKVKLKFPQKIHNWISSSDMQNFLHLSTYERIFEKNIVLYPFKIPLFSNLMNKYIARLPLFRRLTLMHIDVARPVFSVEEGEKASSVSIIIPCKNEAENVEDAVQRTPKMGKHVELIFCDDKSTDGTREKILDLIKKYPGKDIKLVDGPGICKAENVWMGFDHAKGDILFILDADLTVLPEELPYFYDAITTGKGEFIKGSRMVYPMQGDAMKLFNVIGNKLFSITFSYILDTKIKDTLCGTKVFWRKDYEKIKKLRGSWGISDRWGDYELIFGAVKSHLKLVDLPVHYVERTYGQTKMNNRIKNGLVMLKMCWSALWKIKLY